MIERAEIDTELYHGENARLGRIGHVKYGKHVQKQTYCTFFRLRSYTHN